MRKWKNDFKTVNNNETWYDLIDDYELIDSSFTKQYGIRLRYEDNMPWDEFITLLGGLDHETPLGRIVSIRSENDKEVLKNFTKEQMRIRNEWRRKSSKEITKESYDKAMSNFESMFLSMVK